MTTIRDDVAQLSFAAKRAALRCLIAQYLSQRPAEVRFANSGWGRPSIHDNESLSFSTTFAAGIAVFAFTSFCEIGVDAERLENVPEHSDISRRLFSDDENNALAALDDPAARNRLFLVYWTRKEAFLKMCGRSLHAIQGTPSVARAGYHSRDTGSYTIDDVRFDPQYTCALVYNSQPRSTTVLPVVDICHLFQAAFLRSACQQHRLEEFRS